MSSNRATKWSGSPPSPGTSEMLVLAQVTPPPLVTYRFSITRLVTSPSSRRRNCLAAVVAVLRVRDREEVQRHQIPLGVPREGAEGRVDVSEPAVGRREGHADGGVDERGAKAVLAGRQLLLSRFRPGDHRIGPFRLEVSPTPALLSGRRARLCSALLCSSNGGNDSLRLDSSGCSGQRCLPLNHQSTRYCCVRWRRSLVFQEIQRSSNDSESPRKPRITSIAKQ